MNLRLVYLIGAVLGLALAAEPVPAQVMPRVTGAVETVFDWAHDRCALWDIPDAPARAWRGPDGDVRLIAAGERNRVAVGPALGAVKHQCGVVYEGAKADDPAAYDDRAWIASIFAHGDGRIEALLHEEYHGDRRPERCPAAEYIACWRNAIVAVESRDGGGSFVRAPGTSGLVAALPYRYAGDAGRRTGYFNPSNILRDGDYLHAFVFAEAFGAQRRGACLLRRPIEGGAGNWRAWDGRGFGVRFIDPYREDVVDPAKHVCAPVINVGGSIASVVRHEASGRYLAVTAIFPRDAQGVERGGVYAMASDDLIRWSAPEMLWEAPLLWRRDCAAAAVYAYPSLLDEGSASANFDTVGDAFWLYVVRMKLGAGCAVGPDRDLVRMRVSWPVTAAPLAATSAAPVATPDPPGKSAGP